MGGVNGITPRNLTGVVAQVWAVEACVVWSAVQARDPAPYI